ncbi:hypothetical protein GCM10023405_37900 [Streptomonospora salina]
MPARLRHRRPRSTWKEARRVPARPGRHAATQMMRGTAVPGPPAGTRGLAARGANALRRPAPRSRGGTDRHVRPLQRTDGYAYSTRKEKGVRSPARWAGSARPTLR